MHEMGIALQIIQIAIDAIPPEMGDCTISEVNVEIGTLSTIVPESLSFCFEIGSKDTPCSTAKLIIERVPAVMQCGDCQTEWEIEEMAFECPHCGSIHIRTIKNSDIDVVSINIEDQ